MDKQTFLLQSIHLGLQRGVVKIGVITFPNVYNIQKDQSTDLCTEWVLQGRKKWPTLSVIKTLKRVSSESWSKPGIQSSLSAKVEGKQPLLNEPLKERPLHLGFIIFTVSPPQVSSASHSCSASVAKRSVIYSPKSQGWKIPQRNDKCDYYEVKSK